MAVQREQNRQEARDVDTSPPPALAHDECRAILHGRAATYRADAAIRRHERRRVRRPGESSGMGAAAWAIVYRTVAVELRLVGGARRRRGAPRQ